MRSMGRRGRARLHEMAFSKSSTALPLSISLPRCGREGLCGLNISETHSTLMI
jgi:hypothetical protein